MKQTLGGVLVGVLMSGAIVGAVIPSIPAWAGRPWLAWSIFVVSIAASVYLFRRKARMPPRRPEH